MDDIAGVTIQPLKEPSDFVRPFRMNYIQTGNEKSWDLVLQKPSVAVIIYNVSKSKLILVKQFRPAVYASALKRNSQNEDLDRISSYINAEKGITLELCAGIIDKCDKTPAEIAQLEVLEECGYDTPLENIDHVLTFLSGVGIGGENMHLFYTEVTDEMRISKGGGLEIEGEMIDVVEMTCDEVEAYLTLKECKSPMFTIFGLTWFLNNKNKQADSVTNTTMSNSIMCISLVGVLAFVTGMIWSSN